MRNEVLLCTLYKAFRDLAIDISQLWDHCGFCFPCPSAFGLKRTKLAYLWPWWGAGGLIRQEWGVGCRWESSPCLSVPQCEVKVTLLLQRWRTSTSPWHCEEVCGLCWGDRNTQKSLSHRADLWHHAPWCDGSRVLCPQVARLMAAFYLGSTMCAIRNKYISCHYLRSCTALLRMYVSRLICQKLWDLSPYPRNMFPFLVAKGTFWWGIGKGCEYDEVMYTFSWSCYQQAFSAIKNKQQGGPEKHPFFFYL